MHVDKIQFISENMSLIKKLKQNRAASFVVVALVYVIATVVGIAVYKMLELS